MIKIVATGDTSSRISGDYAALDTSSRILLLAKLGNWLTLMGQDTYDSEGGVANAARLRAFNEPENRIFAQLVQLLAADDRRYPYDVFANILTDQFGTLQLDEAEIAKLAAEARLTRSSPVAHDGSRKRPRQLRQHCTACAETQLGGRERKP
jgi:hypothetical protein